MTFEQFYEMVKTQGAYVTKVRMSVETLLGLMRNPGEKKCFWVGGIRVELDETMRPNEFRFLTARQDLGIDP